MLYERKTKEVETLSKEGLEGLVYYALFKSNFTEGKPIVNEIIIPYVHQILINSIKNNKNMLKNESLYSYIKKRSKELFNEKIEVYELKNIEYNFLVYGYFKENAEKNVFKLFLVYLTQKENEKIESELSNSISVNYFMSLKHLEKMKGYESEKTLLEIMIEESEKRKLNMLFKKTSKWLKNRQYN